jgi:hypothetical protein
MSFQSEFAAQAAELGKPVIRELFTLDELLTGREPGGYTAGYNPATGEYGSFDDEAELPEGWVRIVDKWWSWRDEVERFVHALWDAHHNGRISDWIGGL